MARETQGPIPLPPGFEHLQGAVDYANVMMAPRKTLVIMSLVESMVRAGLALVNASVDKETDVRKALEQRLSALESAIGRLEDEHDAAVNERAALREALRAFLSCTPERGRVLFPTDAMFDAARAALALGEDAK